MKKLLLLLFLFLFSLANVSYAQTPTSIDFIYINGSNTNNQEAYDNFIKGISKFHPVLKKHIENDSFTYQHILKNGEYVISDTPSNYFWGYKSQEDLLTMKERAKMLKSVSPWIAYTFRNILAGMLHDAIWVRDSSNMLPILEELHTQIQKDVAEGKKVVLLGYSAGTFITTEYMVTKVAYVDMYSWFSRMQLSDDIMEIVKRNPKKNTCGSALLNSNMIRLTPMGMVEFNSNKEDFKKAYLSMDKQTKRYCIPDDSVIGIINYASPIPLFYSDISNPKYDLNNFFKIMHRYIIENDVFFLTVNFADDPLGFPNAVNDNSTELSKYFNKDLKKGSGFIYDYSSDISWRTVIGAHTCYWNAKERFAKAVVKGYKEGYQYQCNIK